MNTVDIEKVNGPISVLWTGGWDSTYRIVELSMQDVTIEPVYILDSDRKSKEYELKAIETITELIRKKPNTKAKILDMVILKVEELPKDDAIIAAATKFRQEFGWGIQHDWTARAALLYPEIEMCIEKVTKGYMPTREIIKKYGSLTMSSHGWVIDKEKSQEPLKLVLGNITLPIFETTEVEMRANIGSWGYEDVMSHIWFCHNPINGVPCGLCSPCHTKYDSDMHFLLNAKALKRLSRAEKIEKYAGTKMANRYKSLARRFRIL